MKINEHSTDETISELFFEDGYDERNLAGAGFEDCEDFAHKVRKNAETSSLVWTKKHIVGTRLGYQFEVTKGNNGNAQLMELVDDIVSLRNKEAGQGGFKF